MSGPLPDLRQIALDERQEQDSVAIGDRHDFKAVLDDKSNGGSAPPFVSSIRKDEPIVTRRELWSYYRQSSFPILSTSMVLSFFLSKVYYNGDNVFKSIFSP